MASKTDVKWITCTRHAVKFPAGQEQAHREGPAGEQNTAGACRFESIHGTVEQVNGRYTQWSDGTWTDLDGAYIAHQR